MNFNEVKELISMVDSSGFKNFELTLDNCNVKMNKTGASFAAPSNEVSPAAVQTAQVESAATMMAVSLGIEAKTIPYILKMADLSQVMGEDGKINEESLKTAVNKVLEDVPALKPQADGKTGFTQVGTGGNPAQHPQQTTTNQPTVPTKRWNRWN